MKLEISRDIGQNLYGRGLKTYRIAFIKMSFERQAPDHFFPSRVIVCSFIDVKVVSRSI